MLLRKTGSVAMRPLRIVHDAVDFFQRVRERAAASARGDLVLAPPMADNDYTIAARLVASLVGAYLAEAKDYLSKGARCGCQFEPRWNKRGAALQVAVTDGVAAEFPFVPSLLRAAAAAGGSSIEYTRAQATTPPAADILRMCG